MIARRVVLLCTALSLCLGQTLAAQPVQPVLQPIKPWVLDYDTTECFAERTYGSRDDPVTLGIRAVPNGELYELLVARKGPGPRYADQQNGWVDFGRGQIKISLLHYGIKARGISIQKFRITAAQMAQARSATAVGFRVSQGPDARFALRAIPQLLDGLSNCTAMLRKYWNMDENGQVIATPATADVSRLFSGDDYPDEAIYRDQEGSAQFLLLIDERGKVAGCDVIKTTGVPVFEVMGCQVIRERANFKPATDRQGKPVRSTVVTPPILWRLA